MVQSGSKISKIHQNEPKRNQSALKWASKPPDLHQNQWKVVKISQNTTKIVSKLQTSSKWLKMAQNDSKWLKMTPKWWFSLIFIDFPWISPSKLPLSPRRGPRVPPERAGQGLRYPKFSPEWCSGPGFHLNFQIWRISMDFEWILGGFGWKLNGNR